MAKDNKVSQQKELNRLTLEYEKLREKGLEKDEATKALKEKILSLEDEINKSATDRLEDSRPCRSGSPHALRTRPRSPLPRPRSAG